MISGDEILLDTNIIVYSSNTLSPKYKGAVKFREKIAVGEIDAYISHQNIFESIRVLTHPKYEHPMSMRNALLQIGAFRNFCYIVSPLPETEEIALNLIRKYKLKSNQIFDSYLVATMISHGLKTVATDNEKHFGVFQEIKVLNPFK